MPAGREVELRAAANALGILHDILDDLHNRAALTLGAAVLLVSEDLDEPLELSDRLVVMFHGRSVYEARASEADWTEIGRHMAGHRCPI